MSAQKMTALVGLSALIAALAASAETPVARPTDPIYQCAEKADDKERLACFDQAVAALKSAESTGKVRTVDMAAVEKIERESFGFSMPSLTEIFRRDAPESTAAAPEVEKVVLAIKSISVNKVTRRATITLENGQIWEQIDSEELSRSKVRKGKQAVIRKAMMGSFMMTIDDSGTAIRVRRVN